MHLEIFREVKELMSSPDFQIEQEKLVMCIYILRERQNRKAITMKWSLGNLDEAYIRSILYYSSNFSVN